MADGTLMLHEGSELFSALQNADADARQALMQQIMELMYSWAQKSQFDLDYPVKLRPYLTTLLRLSYECPFEQERLKCQGLLRDLKVRTYCHLNQSNSKYRSLEHTKG